MEARFFRAAALAVAIVPGLYLSLGASHRTHNFIVTAPSDEMAREFAAAAEKYRRELAVEWLGRELPRWREPCPITCSVGPQIGAGGATSFMFDQDASGQPQVFGWQMSIQGSRERILDSVLPHEVTHTIFASHFRRPLPRWADEGGSTTVEHVAERAKQHSMLIQFLKTSRGIPFDRMFAMREYPRDIMPLYAQGYATARFLIAQGGKRKFVKFLETGFEREDWAGAIEKHYGYASLAELQTKWLAWIRSGGSNRVAAEYAGVPSRSGDAADDVVLTSAERDRPAEQSPDQQAQAEDAPRTRKRTARPAPLGPVRERRAAAEVDAGDGWYARQSRGEALKATATQHEATHPQPFEPAREVILEWNRPRGQ